MDVPARGPLSRRLALLLALSASGATIALGGGAFVLAGDTYAGVFLPFAGIGLILAWKRPDSPIGWMFSVFGVLGVSNAFAVAYATRGLATVPGSLPGAVLAAWYQSWSWLVYVGLLSTVLLLFPDGRVPTRRWRVVLWGVWLTVTVSAFSYAFLSSAPDKRFPTYVNPFALVLLWEYPPFFPFVFAGLVASAVALLVRARGARGVERQQLKWVGYAVALFSGTLVVGSAAREFGWTVVADVLGNDVVFYTTFSSVPVAIAIAILRYRLYDIDVLINRTLVYGLATGGIAVAFFGGVVVLQTLLRPFTTGSEIAVAASTLLTVALFQPLRSRVQQAVDRRFSRSRYDGARTLDAFAEELRDEVDLAAVREHLLGAVGQTMSPAHASLWLRERAR